MKVLITGSEGNIGSRLVPYLRSCNHTVFCTDQVQKYEDDYKTCNILNTGDLFGIFNDFRPEIVFHLAAMVSRVICERSPYLTIDTNVSGTNNLAILCKQYNAKLIHFSTSEVYGNIGGYLSENRVCLPNNIYGTSKLLSEKIIEYHISDDLDAIIVRPFMLYHEDEIYGINHSALIRFVNDLYRKKKITVHKNSKRSWMHLDDGLKILEKLIYVLGSHTINIGTNELISTEDLTRMICDYYDIEYNDYIIEVPIPERMTLEKYPDIRLQTELTRTMPEINIKTGLKRVLSKYT